MEACQSCPHREQCDEIGLRPEIRVCLMIYLSEEGENPAVEKRFANILRRRGKEMDETMAFARNYVSECPAVLQSIAI